MSLANDILKKLGGRLQASSDFDTDLPEETLTPRDSYLAPIPVKEVTTDIGPMHTTATGKVDGRQLLRGKPKARRAASVWDKRQPSNNAKKVETIAPLIQHPAFKVAGDYELKALMATVDTGDEIHWEWRKRNTRTDTAAATAQRAYVYNNAAMNGLKVKVLASELHLIIRVVQRVAPPKTKINQKIADKKVKYER